MPRNGHYQLNQQEKDDLTARITTLLARHAEIVFAFLYGSFLTEDFFRDIDIGVFVAQMRPGEFSAYENRLSYYLEEGLNFYCPLEVKIINTAPVSFSFQVIRGKVLLCRDDDFLTEFMETTARKYLDQAPLRRQYIREAMA